MPLGHSPNPQNAASAGLTVIKAAPKHGASLASIAPAEALRAQSPWGARHSMSIPIHSHPRRIEALGRYLAVSAVANLSWEVVQLPLYTMWATDTPRQLAYAVLHCTAGDILIALAALLAALAVARGVTGAHPSDCSVLVLTIVFGVSYTIFSEWLNVVVRQSWTYSPLMPTLPLLGTGLSPLLQWLIIPPIALSAARARLSPA